MYSERKAYSAKRTIRGGVCAEGMMKGTCAGGVMPTKQTGAKHTIRGGQVK